MLFVVLAVVVIILIITFRLLVVKKPGKVTGTVKYANEQEQPNREPAKNARNWKTKCKRCGGLSFGIFGTKNMYRCRACGDKTEGPAFH